MCKYEDKYGPKRQKADVKVQCLRQVSVADEPRYQQCECADLGETKSRSPYRIEFRRLAFPVYKTQQDA